jgi:hypothetical protein
MRLTALLLAVVTISVSGNTAIQDISGLWVADLIRCDFGTTSPPGRLIMNVTRDGDLLMVTEIVSGDGQEYLRERLYAFTGGLQSVERNIGAGQTIGRETVLRWSEQLERWSISEGRHELIVQRWIGNSPNASQQQRLIFRRSSARVE